MFDACVVGLGHIGLPTAALLARQEMRVAGVDIAPAVIDSLRRGTVHIAEPGLQDLVGQVLASGRFTPFDSVQPASSFLVTVPTPVRDDHSCDLGAVIAAAESVADHITEGALVVLESTVPPGTTAGPFAAVFERRGFKPGVNVSVAFCPERALPGRTLHEIETNARLVGGVTPACARAAMAFYSRFVTGPLHPTTSTQAEMAKLFENTYRDVNIALANQLAAICNAVGIPARETIALANHHPRVNIHNPGVGVGGHCIPVDPYFLLRHGADPSLVVEARAVNNALPTATARQVEAEARARGVRNVALLGLTYKEDTRDLRDSPALQIARTLAESSDLDVVTFDPYVAPAGVSSCPSLAECVQRAELIVVLVPHRAFIDGLPLLLAGSPKPLIDYTGMVPMESATSPLGRFVSGPQPAASAAG